MNPLVRQMVKSLTALSSQTVQNNLSRTFSSSLVPLRFCSHLNRDSINFRSNLGALFFKTGSDGVSMEPKHFKSFTELDLSLSRLKSEVSLQRVLLRNNTLNYHQAKDLLNVLNLFPIKWNNLHAGATKLHLMFNFGKEEEFDEFKGELARHVDSFLNDSEPTDGVDVALKLMNVSDAKIEFNTYQDFQCFSAKVLEVYEIINIMVENKFQVNKDQLSLFHKLLTPFTTPKKELFVKHVKFPNPNPLNFENIDALRSAIEFVNSNTNDKST